MSLDLLTYEVPRVEKSSGIDKDTIESYGNGVSSMKEVSSQLDSWNIDYVSITLRKCSCH
ncbi:hypothetical protein HS1genome_1224 [Sulfodiicoccus acidiphilus]|uniref:Uncharacterized protein n=1 Tax=Sulfodiicoccus acidiphilus TaxID=1670455 RepID=A0A348B3T3_9CREN|nr:hypothetical protein HS1genome_1224 [Sulfodiicoccus acidiphilus]GGT88612.1 hypothetical protein GCM10007116_03260 [Sulfodiicoccus acidiphilus]